MPDQPPLIYGFSSLGAGLPKPFVLIEVYNAHKQGPGVIVPALVDSGADGTFLPRVLAEQIGHVFDAGDEMPTHGIAGKTVGRKHKMIIRLLGPKAVLSDPTTLRPIPHDFVIDATCCDEPKFGLLGCHDFLLHWEFKLRVSLKVFHLVPSSPEIKRAVAQWRKQSQK